MTQLFKDLADYARNLEKRPAGYARHIWHRAGDQIWGTEAWHCIPSEAGQRAAYGEIVDLWDRALALMGVPTANNVDMLGFEEFSIQFYALYADLIWEFLRTHGVEQ